jgi:two-component sensor histidine kinase
MTAMPRRERRRQVIRRVRDAIWAMEDPEDMGALLGEVRAGMVELEIPLFYCGVNFVQISGGSQSVVSHSMNPQGVWHRLQSKGSQTVLQFWRAGQVVYRRDLTREDPYGEHAIFPTVGCIIDVPFAQGTLAASSRQPEAFSDDDVDLLQDMALLMEDGFRRLDELRVMHARLQVREQVWQMRQPDDIVHVLATLRESFEELGLRYTACGLNLVRADGSFITHTMERDTDWIPPPAEGPQPLVKAFWEAGQVVYRADLEAEDPHDELRWMEGIFDGPVRCVIDIPFSHGTLALNHTEAHAFSPEQVRLLQELAGTLEEGFRRMDDLAALEARNRDLEHSLGEKDVLLKEIHHRVKNNLQVISSLLSLRAGAIEDPVALRSFEDTRAQVQSMALIHERLYESEDLARLDAGAYVRALAENVFSSYGVDPARIRLQVQVEAHTVSVDTAVQCGLVVHELMSNALKHAFPPGRGGIIRVTAVPDGPYHGRLRVEDDGVGVDPQRTPPATSLGLRLVSDLARQMGSSIDREETAHGAAFQVHYPLDPHAADDKDGDGR